MKLSERLEALLALVEKATPETWVATVGGGVKQDHGVHVFIPNRARGEGTHDNAAATAAAINFLRDHGPALAELARRVEDAEIAEPAMQSGHLVSVIVREGAHYKGQRLRLVPEAGQGGGE